MKRLRSVDCLRGAAALAVLLFHAILFRIRPDHSPAWFSALYSLLLQGSLGVPLFFVISGFCIHLRWAKAYARDRSDSLDFLPFWKRRMYRLYPSYLVVLCASMLLVVVAYLLHRDVPTVNLYPQPRPRWMAMDFVAHLLMLHGLHPVFDEGGGNGVYWTLAREEYFYLLYFGLMMVRRRWGAIPAVVSTLVVGLAFPLLMRVVLPSGSPYWSVVNNSALVLWIQWSLGLLAAEAYVGIIRVPRIFSTGWTVPLWAGAAYGSACFRLPLTPLLWGLVFFTALNACVAAETQGRWSSDRFTTWLGGVGIFSYSLYLVHNPVRMVVNQLFSHIPAPSGGLLFLGLAGVIAAAGFGVSLAFFALVERRFLVYKPAHSGSPTGSPLLRENP